MEYVELPDAGSIHIEYMGPRLDLQSFGLLQLFLQEIVDIAIYYLISEGAERPPMWRLPYWVPSRTYRILSGSYRPVRAEVKAIRSGSIEQEFVFFVAAPLLDSDVRAILQGLAANILYGLAQSGVQGLRSRLPAPDRPVVSGHDIASSLRDISATLSQNANGKPFKIKFMYKNHGEEMEVEIEG